MPNYGPFAPAQIDFSPLVQMGQDIGGLIKKRRDEETIRRAMQNGDYSAAVQTLLQAGDTENAAKVAKIQELQQGGQERFSLTPQFDQEGNAYFPGSRGSLNKSGVDLQQPRVFVQTPQAVDERGKYGGTYGTTPKDYVTPEAQKEEGDIRGKAIQALPAAEAMVNRVTGAINRVEKDPNLSNAIGPVQSRLPTLREGTADVEANIEQAIGGTFLSAYETLKGAQAITDVEGEKATAAFTRLHNMKQSEPGYRKALADAKYEVVELANVVRKKAGVPTRPNPYKKPEGVPETPQAESQYNSPQAAITAASRSKGSAAAGVGEPVPSANDMAALRQYNNNPQFRAEFEKIYGPGSVDRWLMNDGFGR